MALETGRAVCGACRKVFDTNLDDEADWQEGPFQDERFDLEYDWLCPDCHAVVVEGDPEDRDWLLRELERRDE